MSIINMNPFLLMLINIIKRETIKTIINKDLNYDT
jgi:hypothetical protein